MSEFEAKIVAYCCNFCALAAADLAGATRLQYPPNVRSSDYPVRAKLRRTPLRMHTQMWGLKNYAGHLEREFVY
jgi:hypothetical protein